MTTNIDPNTGLPELPAGHFWRIKASGLAAYGGSPLEIHIRERVFHFFSNKVDYEYTTEARLLIMAEYMATNLQATLKRQAYREELIGDYPPKKLVIND